MADEIGCEVCGTYSPCTPCEGCGVVMHIGDHPVCPHGARGGLAGLGFVAFADEHIPDINGQPTLTTSLADWNRNMKEGGWSPNIKRKQPRHRKVLMRTHKGQLITNP